jgi:hypothetical protein
MQLSTLAPGLIGLVIAAASIAYAHWIAGRRKRSTASGDDITEDKQLPFEFTSPTLPVSAGNIRVTVRPAERLH